MNTSNLRTEGRAALGRLIPLPLWLLFLLGWQKVLRQAPTGELMYAIEVVAAVAILYGFVISFWIWLNMRQFRLKGPRRQTRAVAVDTTQDVLGRKIELSPEVSLFDAHLVVDLRDGKKIYSSGQPELTEDFVAIRAGSPGHSGQPGAQA